LAVGLECLVDEATERFFAELRVSRTDLARLIERALTRRPSVLMVSADAVTAWEMRAPDAWDQACRWLAAHGIGIVRAGDARAVVRRGLGDVEAPTVPSFARLADGE